MPKLLEQVRHEIRLRHYSIRTEDAYVRWIGEFIIFHGKRRLAAMGEREVKDLLAHLPRDWRKSAAAATAAAIIGRSLIARQSLAYSARPTSP